MRTCQSCYHNYIHNQCRDILPRTDGPVQVQRKKGVVFVTRAVCMILHRITVASKEKRGNEKVDKLKRKKRIYCLERHNKI